MVKINNSRSIIVWAIIACILWSTAFFTVKIALKYISPISLGGIRFTLSGIMLIPLIISKKDEVYKLIKHWRFVMLISLFQTIILYSLFNIGMTMVPAGLTAIIIGSGPLVTAITAHFFIANDRMTIKRTGAIVLGIIGVIIISINCKPWASDTGLTMGLGILLLLGASFSSALGNVIFVKNRGKIDPLVLNTAQFLLGGISLLLLSFMVEDQPDIASWNNEMILAMLWLAFLSAAAFSIWFKLLNVPGVKVSDLNVWKFILPVLGAILSWITLASENPEPAPIIGMIFIAFSVAIYFIILEQEKQTRTLNPKDDLIK